MDLSTTYLGLKLKNPIMPGASPLVDDLDTVKKLEDAGAPAIVMHSLFEEQIQQEQMNTMLAMELPAESFAEALSYFPKPDEYRLGPEAYLEQIRKIKAAVSIPVIGSLNGSTPAGWLDYAKQIQQAGADALELNVYVLATNPWETGEAIERRVLDIVQGVKKSVTIPVSVKLSVFYSSLSNLARKLDDFQVDGLVLFNRFYQPDINIENLEVESSLQLSDSSELLVRLRWLAILAGNVKGSLCASGGVHTPQDAIKALMAGANAIQVVSALLKNGPDYLAKLRQGMVAWLEEHEYESITQMIGSMSLQNCPNPGAFERANYMRVLQSWKA
jgi:dihydroorotate dehydrogenase (fumarate)